jgi:hypothetical protein
MNVQENVVVMIRQPPGADAHDPTIDGLLPASICDVGRGVYL